MSEYIEIEQHELDDPLQLILETNILLAEQPESYASQEELEEGSTLAQALSIIPGIAHLIITEHELTITRSPDTDWYTIVEDIRLALIDFFL